MRPYSLTAMLLLASICFVGCGPVRGLMPAASRSSSKASPRLSPTGATRSLIPSQNDYDLGGGPEEWRQERDQQQ